MNTLGEGPYVPSRRRGRPEIYTPQHPDPDPSQDQASDSGQASTMGEYDGRQCGITCTWTISDIVSESASALEPQRTLDWPWTVRLATVGKLCHPRKVSIRISGFGDLQGSLPIALHTYSDCRNPSRTTTPSLASRTLTTETRLSSVKCEVAVSGHRYWG